ncbi:MAG: hypothetical protein GY862_11070 [Gammaproteobacteria bacterium]|nr:hypothetical protein [Gammaproteobacteria bacterium]
MANAISGLVFDTARITKVSAVALLERRVHYIQAVDGNAFRPEQIDKMPIRQVEDFSTFTQG